MSESRMCARVGCGRSIDHLRADALYCGTTCQREAARQRNGLSRSESPLRFDWSALAGRSATARHRGRKRYGKREAQRAG